MCDGVLFGTQIFHCWTGICCVHHQRMYLGMYVCTYYVCMYVWYINAYIYVHKYAVCVYIYVYMYVCMCHFHKLYSSQNVWDLFSLFDKPLLRRCCIWRRLIIHTRIDPSRNVSTPSEETLGIKQGRDVWFQNNATADSFHIVTSRNSKPELTSIFTWLHPAPILVAMHAWLSGDRFVKKLSTPIVLTTSICQCESSTQAVPRWHHSKNFPSFVLFPHCWNEYLGVTVDRWQGRFLSLIFSNSS